MSTLTARKPMQRTGFKRKQPVSIYKSSTVRAVRIGQNWSHLTGRGKLKQHQEGGSDAT